MFEKLLTSTKYSDDLSIGFHQSIVERIKGYRFFNDGETGGAFYAGIFKGCLQIGRALQKNYILIELKINNEKNIDSNVVKLGSPGYANRKKRLYVNIIGTCFNLLRLFLSKRY